MSDARLELDLREYLSPHFRLSEMLVTTHREIDNRPTRAVYDQLRSFCADFMEPVRERFGPIAVSSGFRCEELNSAIGGARSSAHKYGSAGDFVAMAPDVTTKDVVRWIVDESGLPFDQVIDEYTQTSNWVHLGMLRPGFELEPRGEALVMESWKKPRYSLFVS
jgi:hypothetical protein